MSGFEILGAVAAVSQIIDFGLRVVPKLSRSDKYLKNLKKDIAQLCPILRDLKDCLHSDQHDQIYDKAIIDAIEQHMVECEDIFKAIDNINDTSNENLNPMKRFVSRLRSIKRGSDLRYLDEKLQRLKQDIGFGIQVFKCGQVIQNSNDPVIREQSRLILSAQMNEKKEHETKFIDIKSNLSPTLQVYHNLMEDALEAVENACGLLNHSRYRRLRNGIVHIYRKEAKFFHGKQQRLVTNLLKDPFFEIVPKHNRAAPKAINCPMIGREDPEAETASSQSRSIIYAASCSEESGREYLHAMEPVYSDNQGLSESGDTHLNSLECLLLEWTTLSLEELRR